MRFLRRAIAAALAPSEPVAGGLPWGALYPSGAGAVGLRPRNPGGPPRTIVAATESQLLLAANARRVGATIYNGSSAVLYLGHGPFATSSSYTAQVKPGAHYFLEEPDCYQGDVAGAWAAAAGSAQVTEQTAGQ